MNSKKNTEPTAPREPATIFVADDEAMVVTLVDAILTPAGYRLKLFRDPEMAHKALLDAKQPPALLISDYAMGSLNGLELIKRCKQAYPSLKTILISGTVDEAFTRMHTVKPDKFLGKPFQSKALLEAVRSLLGR